jgi:hypothetical protein
MSQNAVEGYERLGGTRLWSHQIPYGGGSIGRWVDDLTSSSGRYWDGFDRELATHPNTTVLWWSLCTIRENEADGYDPALVLLKEIRRRLPDVQIFVSAQPSYADGHVCDLAGPDGPQYMQDVADRLVAEDLVSAGPLVGPLPESQLADKCHAAPTGQDAMGRRLLDFFG